MQLPPIIVQSKNLTNVREAIEKHLGVSCIKTCTIEEQNIAYIYFNHVEESELIKSFVDNLQNDFVIEHDSVKYVIESMYINV